VEERLVEKISWNFPENNDGNEYGFNDSGIETFMGSKWTSVAKEIIQNALDARIDGKKNVVVKFSKFSRAKSEFPGVAKLADVFDRCSSYYSGHKKVSKFFENAKDHINGDTINYLRVSDYNTTGLSGEMKDVNSNIYKLLKGTGVSNKGVGSSGSFGIGKHAPFALSQFRTIFYHSVREDSSEVFQGVSILTTHENKDGNKTQGKGYYGITDKNQPLVSQKSFPGFVERKEQGTDIIIPGVEFTKDWKKKIVQSVVDQYLVSIIEGELVVYVENIKISKESVIAMFEDFYDEEVGSIYTKDYMTAYTDSDSVRKAVDIFGMGEVEIRIIRKNNGKNRVGYFRNGMKILDKGNFRTSMKFSGILMVRGKELNEFLRQLEPPRHDAWLFGRNEDDPKYAEKVINKIRSEINELIQNIASESMTEESDMDYLKDILPNTSEEDTFDEKDGSHNDELKPINPIAASDITNISKVNIEVSKNPDYSGESGESDFPDEGEGDSGENGGTGGNSSGNAGGGQGDGNNTTSSSNDKGKGSKNKVDKPKIIHKLIEGPEYGSLKFKLLCDQATKLKVSFNYKGEAKKDKSKVEFSLVSPDTSHRNLTQVSANELVINTVENKMETIEIRLKKIINSAYEVDIYEIY
jgi:hypothetical protein